MDLGNSGGTTNENNVVNLSSGDLGVLEDLLDGVDGRLESNGVDLFESSSGDVGREVLTSEKGVDLDSGLGDGRESSLGSLTS